MDIKSALDVLKALLPEWAAAFIPFGIVALIGIYVGFRMSRMKIEGLEERVKLREDQMALKENAIRSASASALRATVESPTSRPEIPEPVIPVASSAATAEVSRFNNLNSQIISELEAKI